MQQTCRFLFQYDAWYFEDEEVGVGTGGVERRVGRAVCVAGGEMEEAQAAG